MIVTIDEPEVVIWKVISSDMWIYGMESSTIEYVPDYTS